MRRRKVYKEKENVENKWITCHKDRVAKFIAMPPFLYIKQNNTRDTNCRDWV